MTLRLLPRSFYERETSLVARELLGKVLEVRGELLATIVETEAYLGPHDLASHSSKGRTPRTEVMFGPAGVSYVYLVYGLHHLLNVVTGNGAAVLVRAVALPGLAGRSGPGKLTRALGITLEHNRLPFDAPPLRLLDDPSTGVLRVASGPRIGIDFAGQRWARRKLRFWVAGHPAVSTT